MKTWLSTAPALDRYAAFDEPFAPAECDCWALLMSLPLLCGSTLQTIPAALPYLHADPPQLARSAAQGMARGADGALRVGLVWRGNPPHENDAQRSLPSLAALPEPLGDFAHTAAVVVNLDLLIGVDTSMVHVAGALGKPVWVLLSDHKTDWRLLNQRADSPWYPGVMRLFRQDAQGPQAGQWGPVIKRVAQALGGLAGASGANSVA